MDDIQYWTEKLKDAERELDAATRLSDLNAAARRYMLAKTELKRLWRSARRGRSDGLRAGDGVAKA
jgi:hypothetical protein